MGPGRAVFRFYSELNDHFTPERQHRSMEKEFFVPGSVKDMIESVGVPHTEVNLVLVNGEESDFSRLIHDGDRVAVYPAFHTPSSTPAFVLDVHLGKLAAYLRMVGFDAAYRSCATDPELARASAEENRVLLTRDRGLLKRSAVTQGYWLREMDSRRQAAEVVRRFDLGRWLQPFTRCMACNALLRWTAKEAVRGRVPPRVAEGRDEFRECPRCRRVYWQGTHYERMREWVEELSG
jgi:uncharacterized protein with PIN domain